MSATVVHVYESKREQRGILPKPDTTARIDADSTKTSTAEVIGSEITNAKKPLKLSGFQNWRKGWDSNPRYGKTVNQISSLAHSTTLPPFRIMWSSFDEAAIIA